MCGCSRVDVADHMVLSHAHGSGQRWSSSRSHDTESRTRHVLIYELDRMMSM